MLTEEWLSLYSEAQKTLQSGFENLAGFSFPQISEAERDVLQQVAIRMQDNFPYQHPLYAGQMLKPPHPLAMVAYMLAMNINPNNHALDGGRASSEMEKEAVAKISTMFGFKKHLGHLTSGGTMANLEALWVAGEIHPDKVIVASEQAHYTHSRITKVLKLPFESIASDMRGKMDLQLLESRLKQGNVGTVVTTLGTTGSGALDPLDKILQLQKQYSFRIHVDTAYGGYFTLADNLTAEGRKIYDCLEHVDSLVIDPHKHGLQPYGCGCVLFADPAVGKFYSHDSPYTYFSSDELHLGEISLECSRAGASAVALWATQKLLPMVKGGEFALSLEDSRSAAKEFHHRLATFDKTMTLFAPELDIVIWAPQDPLASEISAHSQLQFKQAAEQNLHLALISLPSSFLEQYWPNVDFDIEQVSCLRSCLMKAEHKPWLNQIWEIIEKLQ